MIGGGKWKSAKLEKICPASTLMTLCALKKYDQLFKTNYFDEKNFKEGIEYIRKYVFQLPNIVWKEDNLNWNLEFFLPGKLDLLIQIFHDDKVILSIVKYLKNNYIINKKYMFGWGLRKDGVIYTWTTALAIKSLSSYMKYLENVNIREIERIEKKKKGEMKTKLITTKRILNIAILLLIGSIISNIFLIFILPNFDKIVKTFSEMGINLQIILYTLIGVIILSIIGQITQKWFTKLLDYVKNSRSK